MTRWFFLVKPLKEKIKYRNIIDIVVISLLFNFVAPAKIGTVSKSFLLKYHEDIDVASSSPTLLAEVLLDILILLLFFFASFLLEYKSPVFQQIFQKTILQINWKLFLEYGAAVFILLVGIFIFYRFKKSHFVGKIISVVKIMFSHKNYLFKSFLFTIFLWMVSFIQYKLSFLAFGVNISFVFIILMISITDLISYLFPLPGGIGVREVTIAGIGGIIIGNYGIALTVGILARLLFVLALPVLYLYNKIKR